MTEVEAGKKILKEADSVNRIVIIICHLDLKNELSPKNFLKDQCNKRNSFFIANSKTNPKYHCNKGAYT